MDLLDPGADIPDAEETSAVSYTRRKKASCFLDWIVQAVRMDRAGLYMQVRTESAVSGAEAAMKKKTELMLLSGEIESLLSEEADEAASRSRFRILRLRLLTFIQSFPFPR